MAETEDHCSNWPDIVDGINFGSCCKNHDKAYEKAPQGPLFRGWPARYRARKAADKDLRACIIAKAVKKWGKLKGKAYANLMYVGVRAVGWAPWHYRRPFSQLIFWR